MSVKIKMPGKVLQKHGGGRDVVEVNGNTIGECIEGLVTQFPDMKQQLFEESGKVLSEIVIFVNGKVLYPKNLDKPVQDGDELFLIASFFGG